MIDMKELDRYYTVAELAAAVRVNPGTVCRWIRAGHLAAGKTPGGHHRISEAEYKRVLGSFGVAVAVIDCAR